MERKREATKILLQEGLKTLMKSHSFEKITVRMITDEAGVLRPTFYNYYRDKYELLEGIFRDDIEERAEELLDEGLGEEALKLLFFKMGKEKDFYRKAFQVTGQNSFEGILEQYLYQVFLRDLQRYSLKNQPAIKGWKKEVIAKFYSVSLTSIIKSWLTSEKEDIPAEEVVEGYYLLVTHSIYDLIEKKEKE